MCDEEEVASCGSSTRQPGGETAEDNAFSRDCCAAFRVLQAGAQEQLLWDCWRTSEASSGNLENTSASRTKFNNDITIKLDLFHCMRRFTAHESAAGARCHSPESCLQRVEDVLLHFYLVVRWNFRRLVDLKLPGVELPAVFDPVLIAELNNLSAKAKYPALQVTNGDTGERFGLDYVERCCRPVPLNWDKHKTQPSMAAAVAKETEHPAAVEATDRQETSATVREAPASLVPILSFHEGSDVKFQPPWRPSSAPAARTGPMKTGGIVQVLDHGRWTEGAIDGF
ncbi:uncharacterized protein LOC130198353 [Pseudoliparis swirei]|uniref:uncharacterized protein LOC130198353 n=1 Tax=Pseudoliparis swirei TaxID=2059687 RepID=UPI0024BDEC99|nr:uncharacterized protein LOC130198353 [Pseudoliparis swirei]